MIILEGGQALSATNKKSLLADLKSSGAKVSDISAQYVHFVNSDKLSDKDKEIIGNLFDYSEPFQETTHNQQFVVLPRLGTISPWSSKASDIIKNSGASVGRVERGIIYFIQSEAEIDLKKLTDIFSDRMSEIIVSGVDQLSDMFNVGEPKPLKTYSVNEQGKQALVEANKELSTGLSDDDLDYLTE